MELQRNLSDSGPKPGPVRRKPPMTSKARDAVSAAGARRGIMVPSHILNKRREYTSMGRGRTGGVASGATAQNRLRQYFDKVDSAGSHFIRNDD